MCLLLFCPVTEKVEFKLFQNPDIFVFVWTKSTRRQFFVYTTLHSKKFHVNKKKKTWRNACTGTHTQSCNETINVFCFQALSMLRHHVFFCPTSRLSVALLGVYTILYFVLSESWSLQWNKIIFVHSFMLYCYILRRFVFLLFFFFAAFFGVRVCVYVRSCCCCPSFISLIPSYLYWLFQEWCRPFCYLMPFLIGSGVWLLFPSYFVNVCSFLFV